MAGADTFRCRCAGRQACQPAAAISLPQAPSVGIWYGAGWTVFGCEVALVVGDDGAAQVPLGQPGGELGVEAVVVGVPDFDLGPGKRGAVDGAVTWPWNSSGVPASSSRIGSVAGVAGLLGGARDVVRALDGALVALAVLGGDLLDDVLDPHVEEQRPLAVLARR